ncbi:MAG: hypothetical protein SNJ80_09580, partial [Anaerolinea sp.]
APSPQPRGSVEVGAERVKTAAPSPQPRSGVWERGTGGEGHHEPFRHSRDLDELVLRCRISH